LIALPGHCLKQLCFVNSIKSSDRGRDFVMRAEKDREDWKYTQNYADAKTDMVEEILAQARRVGGEDKGD
jgi:hypothetical protein